MRIKTCECQAYSIPQRAYVVGGARENIDAGQCGRYFLHQHYRAVYSPSAETALVKLTTDTGLVAWGEAQSGIVPEAFVPLVDELLAPMLVGADPTDPAVLRDKLYDLMRERGHDSGYLVDAIAACDNALWDLLGKIHNVPTHKLLGGAYRTKLPVYVSGVPSASIDEEIETMRAWVDKGFTAFKLSYEPTVEAHVEHITRIREALGDDIELFVDAHWAFTFKEALRLGRALAELNVGWLECPLIPEDAEAQARLAQELPLPHTIGEEYRTRWHFQDRLRRGAIDIANPDIGRTGVTEGLRIMALCETYNVPLAWHLGAGLGVYIAVTFQLAAATPGLRIIEYQPSQLAICDDYYTPSLQPTAGCFDVPTTPGVGAEPDEDRMREYRVK